MARDAVQSAHVSGLRVCSRWRRVITKRRDATHVSKNHVDMWIYAAKDDLENAAVVYQETRIGHSQEFRHHKSAFIFYIIVEGAGIWVIEDEEFPVEATDLVVVPAGKRFYYRGNLKQVCITVPAWTPEHEEVTREVEL
jgi:mannose-6-phosphate isomerase-like protein (cupin superfamily)